MKVGDLVSVRNLKGRAGVTAAFDACTGVIIDVVEMEDGFEEFEVLLEDGDIGWFSDMSLKVVSSSK